MRVVSFDIGLRNLAWCDLDVQQEDISGKGSLSQSLNHWLVESAVSDEINVNATSLEFFVEPFTKLCQSIVDRLTDLSDVDAVLIESQPMGHGRSFGGTSMGGSPRNLKTKVLSHILQSIFIAKGISSEKIHFISPMLKLRECPIPFRERNYKDNKKWAIEKTQSLIEDTCDAELFVGSKRDDLADCFLQGQYVAKLVLNGSMKLDSVKPIAKKAEAAKPRKTVKKATNDDTDSKKRKRSEVPKVSQKAKRVKAIETAAEDF